MPPLRRGELCFRPVAESVPYHRLEFVSQWDNSAAPTIRGIARSAGVVSVPQKTVRWAFWRGAGCYTRYGYGQLLHPNKKRGECPVFYFASSAGITETVFLSPRPRLNFTMPAIFANNV